MRTWTFSNQIANVVIVTVTYTVSVFYAVTASAATTQEVPMPLLVPYVSTDACTHSVLISEELENSVRFQGLVEKWHAERGATSSIDEMCTRPAYLSILAMGAEALPLLIGRLKIEGDNPDHWFVALHYITKGADPVPEADKGNMAKMASAWIDWASRQSDAG